MPYSSVSEVPDYVPKEKRKQWLEVFNSAYSRAKGSQKEREASAFAQANGVAGPNAEKYSDTQPRDENGRWSAGEAAADRYAHGQAVGGHARAADWHKGQREKLAAQENAAKNQKAIWNHQAAEAAHRDAAHAHTIAAGGFSTAEQQQAARTASRKANAAASKARVEGHYAVPHQMEYEGGQYNAARSTSMKKSVEYVPVASMPEEACQFCKYYWKNGKCINETVIADDTVPHNADGCAIVAATGWCNKFESRIGTLEPTNDDSGDRLKAAIPERWQQLGINKLVGGTHIPFCKVDEQRQEVWGIVTAEVPDKDDEVCDYAKSKPYYEEAIAEQSDRSEGLNMMPLREMHQPSAVGNGIGYEFRDPDREIFFGFKVTDDRAWKKVVARTYTGFSHGGMKVGEMVPDPVFKGCMRYVAKPVEVSLVDNPCLGIARFTHVSKSGEVTLRKNRCVEDRSVSLEKFTDLQKQVDQLHEVLTAKLLFGKVKAGRTKRVAGEDLPASAFLIVGDPERTDTWNLPVKFSTDAKTKSHIRNALARINQVKGVSDEERASARKKLHALASKHGIEVDAEKARFGKIASHVRDLLRTKVNRYQRAHGDPGYLLTFIDSELGKLNKGMYEVSCLAQHVQCLTCLFYQVVCEQQYEGDDNSPLPGMLESNLNELMDTLVAMVAEEVSEQRDEIAERKAAPAEL